MASDNQNKYESGKSNWEGLRQLLQGCVKINYLKSVEEKVRLQKKGYANTFYASFLIEFTDGEKWALYTSKSIRSDRVKGTQWDASNLKQIDTKIKAAYLIYPDDIDPNEETAAERKNIKYQKKIEYSKLDGIVSQDKIYNLIEQHALKGMSGGKQKNTRGTNFEIRIANLLKFDQNLEKWKNPNNHVVGGTHYPLFKKIVDCLELNPASTESIDATSDSTVIGRLKSGGSPKTDILITVHNTDGSSNKYTISCKLSNDSWVSVDQHKANDFANVLDPKNQSLKTLLNNFQKKPTKKDFGKNNIEALTTELAPYVDKLSLWVLGGYGGSARSKEQYADYILINLEKGDTFTEIYRIQNYYELLKEAGGGYFGTPFRWTYPSKRRGKYIQLKCKILKNNEEK